MFYINKIAIDQNKTNQSIILNNIKKRDDQRYLYNQLIGNTYENCKLSA
jgi:hypothetical protein